MILPSSMSITRPAYGIVLGSCVTARMAQLCFFAIPAEQLHDGVTVFRIEGGSRLVGEDDRRRRCDGARDCDALLLAPAQGSRIAAQAMVEAHIVKRRLRALFALRCRKAADIQAELHIVERGERGEQIVRLEDEPEMPAA